MIIKENIVSVTKIYNTAPNNDFTNTYIVVYNTNKECFVPHDTENMDYQEILAWVSAGNTITDNGGSD